MAPISPICSCQWRRSSRPAARRRPGLRRPGQSAERSSRCSMAVSPSFGWTYLLLPRHSELPTPRPRRAARSGSRFAPGSWITRPRIECRPGSRRRPGAPPAERDHAARPTVAGHQTTPAEPGLSGWRSCRSKLGRSSAASGLSVRIRRELPSGRRRARTGPRAVPRDGSQRRPSAACRGRRRPQSASS